MQDPAIFEMTYIMHRVDFISLYFDMIYNSLVSEYESVEDKICLFLCCKFNTCSRRVEMKLMK